MSEKFNSRVSAEGAALIADAVINNTKMSFLKAYGSTTEFADAQLPKLTDKDLTGASHNQNGHISNVSVDKDTNTVRTEIVLDGSTVEADYGLNSILMVATVDGKEHLFAVLKANQTQYMNAYDGKSSTNLQINCSFIISNTDVVDILKVDSAGTLTRADYDELHKFTVDQVAITVTNVNKYTDASVSKEADIRLAADIDEIKARSDADDIERKARIAADNTESKARAAADDAAAKDLSTLKGTVSTNYTNATIYADGAVNKEAAIRLAADNTESKARSAADAENSKAAQRAQSTADAKYPAGVIEIPANSDLNSYTKEGNYHQNVSTVTATIKNMPVDNIGPFGLQVLHGADNLQILTTYSNTNSYSWLRTMSNNNWCPWLHYEFSNQDSTITGKKIFSQPTTFKFPTDLSMRSMMQLDFGVNSKNVLFGLPGDANGDAIGLGAGGLTVIGSGESTSNYLTDVMNGTFPTSVTKHVAMDEYAVVVSDGPVHLISHFQDNDGKAKEATLEINGNFNVPGAVLGQTLDTRGAKQNPAWYQATYPKSVIREFKALADLDITMPSGQTTNWFELETRVPWNNNSGGYAIQTAYSTASARPLMFIRKGTSDTAWSAWEQMTTW